MLLIFLLNFEISFQKDLIYSFFKSSLQSLCLVRFSEYYRQFNYGRSDPNFIKMRSKTMEEKTKFLRFTLPKFQNRTSCRIYLYQNKTQSKNLLTYLLQQDKN
jgi:hypothetical protein